MKIIKTASGNQIKMSKSEWQSIGKEAGWVKVAMGDPKTDYSDPISGIFQELIAAKSSLNMEPEPIAPENEGDFYLSQTDNWAKHAYNHIDAALKILSNMQK